MEFIAVAQCTTKLHRDDLVNAKSSDEFVPWCFTCEKKVRGVFHPAGFVWVTDDVEDDKELLNV